MSDDDEFDTPQYRMNKIESPKRSMQLRPHTPTFGLPPRTDSFQSFSVSFSEAIPPSENSLPRRVKSTSNIYDILLDSNTSSDRMNPSSLEPIDSEKVKIQLKKLYPNATPFIEKIVRKSSIGKNQIIIDILNETTFLPLSSILQSHKGRKALIIVPSMKISQWIRSFLIDSTALCPEGRSQQQKVLAQISSGRTQVLLCIANRLSTLNLTLFDIIFVAKSELCEDSLNTISNFPGIVILHQTPGFTINTRHNFEVSKNPDLSIQCTPTAIFEENYLDALDEAIDNEEKTCVIAPFKTVIDKIFKRIHSKSVKFSNNFSNDDCRACVSTTAVFYTMATFDHYIFVDFPPSLSYLLMASYIGRKVTVFVNTTIGLRLQTYSHSRGIDLPNVQHIVQSIFWSGSHYRKANEMTSISISGLDITNDSFNDLVSELSNRQFVKYLPFNHQILNIKINSIVHQRSALLSAVSQNRSNMHGFYNIPIISLCTQLNLTPMQLESELESLQNEKVIQYRFMEKSHYFTIIKEFSIDDDDEFMDTLRDLTNTFAAREDQRDHEFDLIYHVLKNPDDFTKVSEGGEPEEVEGLPHSPLNIEEIKKLLTNSRRSEWTPRAVARVFHGVSSPLFSSEEWSRSPYWNKQSDASFKDIMQFCQKIACNPTRITEDMV
ncbi:hypothetical protein TRFO_08238 [Tritrichomonas foetus]|uniref:Uncharacterized protein n=1 Tax=Tritrichomonas foetus TaxID=1144522 RepID=A0A1J4JMI9_9EUKA|nr:hypothetical protein TRFO_08238 [Tritrichomonas foetus]|eukprot:OHS99913.1 hypothetical protein TRFO_08238 [Tritrichomonas foetus]